MTGAVPPHPRVLLFTGKGGVGKTTLAAATALACADGGARHANHLRTNLAAGSTP